MFACIAAARFLRTEPPLPRSIVGADWPPNQLRESYEDLRQGHAVLVRDALSKTQVR